MFVCGGGLGRFVVKKANSKAEETSSNRLGLESSSQKYSVIPVGLKQPGENLYFHWFIGLSSFLF